MSIVTESEIVWDEIDSLIKSKIIDFYCQLWQDCATSFCSKRIPMIKNIHYKACQSSQIGKAYLVLDWHSGDTDDAALVDIKGIPIDFLVNEIDNHDKESDEYRYLCYAIEKVSDDSKILVYSNHNHLEHHARCSRIFYKQDGVETSLFCKGFPLVGTHVQLDLSIAAEVKERTEKRESKSQEPQKATEQSREDSLYDWLRMQGVDVERQVKTSSNHTIDLWIPDKMMIELKRSSVSGNDICQCIEYASEYRLPIVLVGDKISGAASRGIKGFNKLCPKNKILFISWDAIHDFLKGRLLIGE